MNVFEKLLSRSQILALALLVLPSIWSLSVPGYYGASDDMHPAWIYQVDRTIKLGQFPPRYVPDLSFGFGYPLFNFISPLPFYIGEVFHLSGLNLVDSTKATFASSMIFSALAMYLLVKSLSNRTTGLIAAALYTYTPYRATDLYIRGTIGEMWAFVFYPLIILAIYKIWSEKNNYRWIGLGGLSVAGLILSHNIGTYMFLPFAVVLALMMWASASSLNKILRTMAMFTLGLLISAYFWIPALVDSKLMKYETVFSFADHFPTLKQLVTPYFGFGGSTPGPNDTMSFFIGVANLILIVLAIVFLAKYWKRIEDLKRVLVLWAVILFISSVAMMNYRSVFIWVNLPLLDYFQFPWRFLMMTTLAAPVLLLILDKSKYGKILVLIIGVIALVTTASNFHPEHFLGRTDEYYLKKFIPVPLTHPEYYHIQEEYLRLPKDTIYRPDKVYPIAEVKDGSLEVIYSDGLNSELKIWGGTSLDYFRYNFPGWVVKVNGQQVQPSSGEPFGQIHLDLTGEQNEILVKFTETKDKIILNLFSLAALILGLLLTIKGRRLDGPTR